MRHFSLCAILIALLTVQPVCAQEVATIPLQTAATTPSPASSAAVLPEGTEVHFVLLDSISSATATKGQMVHFAIAQDEISLFPHETTAIGAVKSVRKGIPGKQNGSLELEPRTIMLPNGTKLKLVRSTEDCQITSAGCWVFLILATTMVAVFLPIELPVAVVYAIKHPHQRRLLTPMHANIEGTDVMLKPGQGYTAYTTRKLKISPTQDSASKPAKLETLTIFDSRTSY